VRTARAIGGFAVRKPYTFVRVSVVVAPATVSARRSRLASGGTEPMRRACAAAWHFCAAADLPLVLSPFCRFPGRHARPAAWRSRCHPRLYGAEPAPLLLRGAVQLPALGAHPVADDGRESAIGRADDRRRGGAAPVPALRTTPDQRGSARRWRSESAWPKGHDRVGCDAGRRWRRKRSAAADSSGAPTRGLIRYVLPCQQLRAGAVQCVAPVR
jgi:hypothetical protein